MSQFTVLNLSKSAVASGDSGVLAVDQGMVQLAVDINVSTLDATTVDFYVERQAADLNWYLVWHPTQLSAAGIATTSIGRGLATAVLPVNPIRLRWVTAGGNAHVTFTASIIAR